MDHINDDYEFERIRTALNLPDDDGRIVIEIDREGREFLDTWCDVTDTPAAVHVNYCRHDKVDDETYIEESAYSWDVAGGEIAGILKDPEVTDDEITVTVNAWYLIYALKAAA